MSINDFIESLWVDGGVTDGEGAQLTLRSDQWWAVNVECWCAGENDSHTFRRASRSLFDLEETLHELHEVMSEEDAHGDAHYA